MAGHRTAARVGIPYYPTRILTLTRQPDGMADRNRPRIAVIGAGHRGRGWTALALSRGWSVSLYDLDSSLLQRASDDVGERVRRLTDIGRAAPLAEAGALDSLRIGRS